MPLKIEPPGGPPPGPREMLSDFGLLSGLLSLLTGFLGLLTGLLCLLAGLLGRKSAGATTLGQFEGVAGLPDELISALETRAIWAKFGF